MLHYIAVVLLANSTVVPIYCIMITACLLAISIVQWNLSIVVTACL